MATSNDPEILEGFLCPICIADLKSATQLTNHFESFHKGEQDVLKAFFDELGKTFINGLNIDIPYTYYPIQEQVEGVSKSFTSYFNSVRSSRLERYAAETNKLLIRLDKLVTKMPSDPNQRKHHEQDVVPWLDESLVSLCPNCAKTFNLTRRKHHCRLCGSILCHDCSVFLDINIAKSIVDPSAQETPSKLQDPGSGLRLCEHCYKLIELWKQVLEGRKAKSTLAVAYEQMRKLMEEATPAVAMYEKMCQSLLDGETAYNLSDVNAMRGRIGKLAEGIDSLSKQVAALPADAGSRQVKLHAAIRQAAAHYIKEELLSLTKLPTEAQIEEVRRIKYENAIHRVTTERKRLEMELYEVVNEDGSSQVESIEHDENNPLLEQMNIIRGYIKEARKELRFDEVATLEQNLKDLKKEYQFQLLSNRF